MVAKSECSDCDCELTIQHVCCELILASEGKDQYQFPHYTHYHETLLVLAWRIESLYLIRHYRANNWSIQSYQLQISAEKSQLQRLNRYHQHCLTQKKLSHLQEKLRNVIDQEAIPVDEDTYRWCIMYERWRQRRKRVCSTITQKVHSSTFFGKSIIKQQPRKISVAFIGIHWWLDFVSTSDINLVKHMKPP